MKNQPTREQLTAAVEGAKGALIAYLICIAFGWVIHWNVLVWVSAGWAVLNVMAYIGGKSAIKTLS